MFRYNYVREKVAEGDIVMQYRQTTDMTSDILTKPLPPKQFLHLRPQLLRYVVCVSYVRSF
jgi:hypothetical protein